MINYIGLDTSLSSTGMYIKTPTEEYYFNYRNSCKDSKWHKTFSYVRYYDYLLPETNEFSEEQIVKLKTYDEVTDAIINDMVSICNPAETVVITESYSYASTAGPLIDLVTYATLLRNKILKKGFLELIVVPPTSLKSRTCIKVYGPGELIVPKRPSKKVVAEKRKPSRNHIGIPGGKFQKQDMLLALFESDLDIRFKRSLQIHANELVKMKGIPSPISDIVDAIWLVEAHL